MKYHNLIYRCVFVIAMIAFNTIQAKAQGDALTIEHSCLEGSLDLNIIGGYEPYDVEWQALINGVWQTLPGWPKYSLVGDDTHEDYYGQLDYTMYKVIVHDRLCGMAEAEITVNPCKCLKVNLEYLQNVDECGYPNWQKNTGAIGLSITGLSNYSVLWSNGSRSESINKLLTGSYTVTVTAGACQIVNTYTICCCNYDSEEPPGFPVLLCTNGGRDITINDEDIVSPTSANSRDGSISLNISGGAAMIWYDEQGNRIGYGSSISGLNPGTYCIQISNGCGKWITECYTLVDCSKSTLSISGSKINTCNGYTEGAITASASGGKPTYKYKWSNGSTNSNIGKLAVGTYCVTVTDMSGCKRSKCFVIGLNALVSVGCQTFCNNKVVLDYGPSINIPDPFDCTKSLTVCSKNRNIILRQPFNDLGVYTQNCNAIYYNRASGQTCYTEPGESCRKCIFGVRGKEVYNAVMDYCVYPSLNVTEILGYRDFKNITVSTTIGEEGSCYFQVYNNCVDKDNEAFGTYIQCDKPKPYYQVSAASIYPPGYYNPAINCEHYNGLVEEVEELVYSHKNFIDLENLKDLAYLKPSLTETFPKVEAEIEAYINLNCNVNLKFNSLNTKIKKVFVFETTTNVQLYSLNYKPIVGTNNVVLEDLNMLNNSDSIFILLQDDEVVLNSLNITTKCDNLTQNNLNGKTEIFISPNPVIDLLKFNFGSSSIAKEFLQTSILSLDGKVIIAKDFLERESLIIDTSNLSSGMYFIKITTEDSSNIVFKFIKS